ncbi:Pls/PosA family non-ribosomal peptide synthetase [Arthrobacter bussei]|uniref:Pls/PosA family non-ribosomal peptide synthetase n=1 Tax=Arthrobacter bussei TaxID=2594179 RepID=UPI0030CA52ED
MSPGRPAVRQAQFAASGRAPEPRTLLDILHATAAAHPSASALDDGTSALSYAELVAAAEAFAVTLRRAGVGRGDAVGVRLPSGTSELYIAILGVLTAGAAYVPVDADDPDERALVVFAESRAAVVVGPGLALTPAGRVRGIDGAPTPDDDAWIIFTSGSTGTPKGVAVTHRSAAAFVDAEARLFLQREPIGPADRVLAGLSVAFDASCEEMWLAWRHGACLVPAPRALVRTGVDLGPWLIARGITVVSTVPTLAALWPADALENVRLLIFGGEACPPDLAQRLAVHDREVWNTYGPTEATVVACAARLGGGGPVRIGLPLDGWDLAVVDGSGVPVPEGAVGELIIGGVGLARYLDPAKDAEKYAPLPTLGWDRAYRSGDLVKLEAAGLVFVGRADDQVKLGGRRVELGEVDAALQALPGIAGAAAAVRTTPSGNQLLVGYLVAASAAPDLAVLRALLAEQLPAALVPLLTVTDALPTKTSGKVDRDALPWPVAGREEAGDATPLEALDPQVQWIADQWAAVLGTVPVDGDADFFLHGGGSLAAARLVSLIRARYPVVTVADIYAHPRLGALAALAASTGDGDEQQAAPVRTVRRTSRRSQVFQTLMGIPLQFLAGMRWLTYAMIATNVLVGLGVLTAAPTVPWPWVAASWLVFVSPFGRMALSVAAARILLRGVLPGVYPRSGRVHLRLWLAEQISDSVGAVGLASAPWVPVYARALGARIGPDVDLHSVPPVTGFLTLGAGASVEPEVDLSGWWIDGDRVHIGAIDVGAGAVVGARSTLMPGARVGARAEVAPGSAVQGAVKAGQLFSGSPAVREGRARQDWPDAPPSRSPFRARMAFLAFAAASGALALIPFVAAVVASLPVVAALRGAPSLAAVWPTLVGPVVLAAVLWLLVNALLVVVTVRLLGLGLQEGHYPARSRTGWRIWATERTLDMARDLLFPLYASLVTPVWLRLLGARVGRNVEASTVLLIPAMTTIGEGAFLADDTRVASYELGGGHLRIAPAKIGRRAFLGNSGMTSAGRRVPKNSLVAVLSATPAKAKAGSSWLGSPPSRLRRLAVTGDRSRTFQPPPRLKAARAFWELCRIVPIILTVMIAAASLVIVDALALWAGHAVAALLSGLVFMALGAVAAGSAVLAKWLLVGRIRAGEHPLWSSFIWRNEVVDTFIESVSAPWFARAASGTPALVWWLRALGSKIGQGVWCESYWLPEADLVTLGAGSTVNRGCVVQTHLFHDRIMSMDTVELAAGATLGPHSVILPAADIGSGATVGPASLVMRGETVPAGSSWMGNPVSSWTGPGPVRGQ